jgi:hypothetical protein
MIHQWYVIEPIEKYLLFDFPGQVELFTHHQSCRNILHQLQKWKYQVRYLSPSTVSIINYCNVTHFIICQ